jgi:hypothetical protein
MRNLTRDLLACNIVPQPTTLPRAPSDEVEYIYLPFFCYYLELSLGSKTGQYMPVCARAVVFTRVSISQHIQASVSFPFRLVQVLV